MSGPGVLAVLNLLETAASVLAAARMLGARLGADVEVLHVLPPDTHLAGEEIVPAAERARLNLASAERSAALRAAFDRAGMGEAVWREIVGDPAGIVARQSRMAGFVVLGQAPPAFYEDAWTAIDAALNVARAAVLLVPEAAPVTLGAHVAVAWKDDGVARHAIEAAMPVLRQAARVTVLVGREAGTASAAASPALLDDAGIAYALLGVDVAGHVGLALGHEAAKIGADLLVMGAFGHGRLRERLFGGATHEVLAAVPLPVLMRH